MTPTVTAKVKAQQILDLFRKRLYRLGTVDLIPSASCGVDCIIEAVGSSEKNYWQEVKKEIDNCSYFTYKIER